MILGKGIPMFIFYLFITWGSGVEAGSLHVVKAGSEPTILLLQLVR